ncbi:hypothetical protein [Eisenbergiella porci]|uniref:hypothetical protein n=1 Tax=Eisenbergiella porci TaxID=2652274 RepID=UPI002A7F131B|nr:hypothetical protein [Eisenbergiella porci]
MECTGKIKDISRGLDTNNFVVTIEVSDITLPELKRAEEQEKLSFIFRTWRKKRSLDANAYYWVLVEKIAKLNKSSKNVVHNIMLERYGALERMEGGQLIPICIRDDIDHREMDYMHLKPTSKTLEKGGIRYRWYYLIKGSSQYDYLEMSVLIDGIVSECKELEIETLPPDELRRMKEAWKP